MYGMDPQIQQRRRIAFAVGLGAIGAVVLAALVIWDFQTFPSPIWLWGIFAVAVIYFEWNAVEVNDRLFVSPSLMVIMTAAVSFTSESAMLGVASIAALGLVTPLDIRERRWFQPAANFGQFVITSTVSVGVLILILGSDFAAAPLWRIAVAGGLAAVVYGVLNVAIVTLVVRAVFGQRGVRSWSNMTAIILPMVGMGLLGGLLGAAYLHAGPHMLPLIFAVFFLAQMTFGSYAQLREAQESTLRGFIKALEAKDLYTRGHTERVAYFANLIGQEMGFSGTRLERLRWAALIHDVGKLAVPRDLIRKRARLTDEEYDQMQTHTHLVEDLLAEVEFLQPMIAIAANHHTHFDGTGYGPAVHADGETAPPLESSIIAVADSFDAMTSTRSYRVALTQEYAFSELRRCSGSQFDPKVVEAFIAVLTRRGERYGSPDLADDAEARRQAEDKATVDG